MKKYILIIRTEMSDKKMLMFTIFIIFMIISCILGFFGTIYGRQYQLFHNNNYIISGVLNNSETTIYNILDQHESELKYYFVSNIIDKDYQDYHLISISNNYDMNEDLQGTYDKESNDTIVIPYAYSIQEKVNIGDQIEMNGKAYTVTGTIGLLFDNTSFLVSKDEFINKARQINLEVIVNKNISQKDYEQIISEITPNMNEDFYFSEFDKDTSGYLKQFRIYAIILFMAAIINVVYIYSYTMTKRKNRMIAYRLAGATNRWIYVSIIIDNLGIFTFCYFLAVLVTNAFYNLFLVPNIPNTAFILSIKDIVSFYLSMLVIYFIIMLIYLRRGGRTTITELTHKEGF